MGKVEDAGGQHGGRRVWGEDVYGAKLDARKVMEVRVLLAAGIWKSFIAHRYRVGQVAVEAIESGRTWKDVTDTLTPDDAQVLLIEVTPEWEKYRRDVVTKRNAASRGARLRNLEAHQEGVPEGHRRCHGPLCLGDGTGTIKPLSEFYLIQGIWRARVCRACQNQKNAECYRRRKAAAQKETS